VVLTATVTATWADNQRRRRPSGGPVRLSEVGHGAVFGVVAEPEPDGVVDRDAVEVGRVDEPYVGGLVADGEGAADDSAVVGDVEFLADFAARTRYGLRPRAHAHLAVGKSKITEKPASCAQRPSTIRINR
jgi:hypothetical protein